MLYLCDVMKNYKNEVKDFLAADQQMATEIQYDLKRFEEQQQQQQQLPLATPPTQQPASPRRPPLTPRAGSPKVTTPAAKALSKTRDLSTLAILNSARKAMQARAQQLGNPQPPSTPSHQPRTPGAAEQASKHVGWADANESAFESSQVKEKLRRNVKTVLHECFHQYRVLPQPL